MQSHSFNTCPCRIFGDTNHFIMDVFDAILTCLFAPPIKDSDAFPIALIDKVMRAKDDIIDVIDEEAEEDLMALAGVGESNVRSSLLETLQGRSSWLLINLLTAIVASAVIGLFDATIERIVALAVLMPIVASMGGNAGTQTVTVAVRALALRQIDRDAAASFVRRELAVAVLNGILFAALAAGISFLWFRDPDIAVVMAVAMFANMVVAGLSGTLVPLGLVRAGVDPAVASSVFITTITDVVGFFVFLGLAALYLIQ